MTDLPSASAPTTPLDALDKVQRLFPLTQQEDLKVYGILSVHTSIASFINEHTCQLIVLGAYTLDQALNMNKIILQERLKDKVPQYAHAVLISSIGYQHAVPVLKMAEMIEFIEEENRPLDPTTIEKKAKSVQEMESYARYIFDHANASAYEKGILTTILGRFRSKMLVPE